MFLKPIIRGLYRLVPTQSCEATGRSAIRPTMVERTTSGKKFGRRNVKQLRAPTCATTVTNQMGMPVANPFGPNCRPSNVPRITHSNLPAMRKSLKRFFMKSFCMRSRDFALVWGKGHLLTCACVYIYIYTYIYIYIYICVCNIYIYIYT